MKFVVLLAVLALPARAETPCEAGAAVAAAALSALSVSIAGRAKIYPLIDAIVNDPNTTQKQAEALNYIRSIVSRSSVDAAKKTRDLIGANAALTAACP